MWRRSAVWVSGTAGLYSGLYGFAAANRAFVVLGIVLVVLALAVTAAWILGRQSRRRRVWINGTALVREVSRAPASGEYGRGELTLVVTAPGLPSAEIKMRDSRVPVRSWPEAGDTVPIRVDVDDLRRVRVRWDEFTPEESAPVSPVAEADEDLEFEPPMFTEEELDSLAAGPRRVLPLEDEPTVRVARYLFPTERYRGEWRRHWIRPGVRYVLTLGASVTGEILVRRFVPDAYLPPATVGVAVAGGLIALHVLYAWYEGCFVLTGRRVMLIEGVLRRRVSMVPLLRVTDLRFEQSLPGRLLGYGDFVIEGMGFLSRIRRITSLPRPNELYLRIVEEMYEPGAVEARLGGGASLREERLAGEDPGDPFGEESPVTNVLTQAVREAIYGPTLANYDGWVSIDVRSADGVPVPVTGDRRVHFEPGREYDVRVVIGPGRVAEVAEPLVVSGGVDREAVEFTLELDSDQRTLRRPARTVEIGPHGGAVTFTIRAPADDLAESPWLWVRISQQRRLLQSIELIATVRVTHG